MIDCGESTFGKWRRVMRFGLVTRSQFSSSHLHADHIGSLGSFASYCLSVLQKRITVIAQDDTVVEILKLMGVPADMYDFTTDYTQIFEDGLHVEAVPVKHASDMKCCGFLIRDEDETIYFSADASELSDDTFSSSSRENSGYLSRLHIFDEGKSVALFSETAM